jgi:alkylhydroperoxidase family enzyme
MAALMRYLKAVVDSPGSPPMHLHEEAREAGWSDEQILEAIAFVALERFTAMLNVAGEVPVDGSVEDTRALHAA